MDSAAPGDVGMLGSPCRTPGGHRGAGEERGDCRGQAAAVGGPGGSLGCRGLGLGAWMGTRVGGRALVGRPRAEAELCSL